MDNETSDHEYASSVNELGSFVLLLQMAFTFKIKKIKGCAMKFNKFFSNFLVLMLIFSQLFTTSIVYADQNNSRFQTATGVVNSTRFDPKPLRKLPSVILHDWIMGIGKKASYAKYWAAIIDMTYFYENNLFIQTYLNPDEVRVFKSAISAMRLIPQPKTAVEFNKALERKPIAVVSSVLHLTMFRFAGDKVPTINEFIYFMHAIASIGKIWPEGLPGQSTNNPSSQADISPGSGLPVSLNPQWEASRLCMDSYRNHLNENRCGSTAGEDAPTTETPVANTNSSSAPAAQNNTNTNANADAANPTPTNTVTATITAVLTAIGAVIKNANASQLVKAASGVGAIASIVGKGQEYLLQMDIENATTEAEKKRLAAVGTAFISLSSIISSLGLVVAADGAAIAAGTVAFGMSAPVLAAAGSTLILSAGMLEILRRTGALDTLLKQIKEYIPGPLCASAFGGAGGTPFTIGNVVMNAVTSISSCMCHLSGSLGNHAAGAVTPSTANIPMGPACSKENQEKMDCLNNPYNSDGTLRAKCLTLFGITAQGSIRNPICTKMKCPNGRVGFGVSTCGCVSPEFANFNLNNGIFRPQCVRVRCPADSVLSDGCTCIRPGNTTVPSAPGPTR